MANYGQPSGTAYHKQIPFRSGRIAYDVTAGFDKLADQQFMITYAMLTASGRPNSVRGPDKRFVGP